MDNNVVKTYRGITIEPCLNGFIVGIGCQRAVFKTLHEVSIALDEYDTDLDRMEKQWMERSKRKYDGTPVEVRGLEEQRQFGEPTPERTLT